MCRIKLYCSVAALALLTSAAAGGARAQTRPAGAPGSTLEEVVVTARRQEENQQTTPVSVTAVSARELTARGVENVADVATFTPNMAVSPAIATKNSARITVRGQVQNDALITTDPSVGVYIDDVYYARAYSALTDLLDIGQVEVLKGPQGTLYGRNTTGGAIKITTRKPSLSEGSSGYLTGGVGNFSSYNLEGAVTIPIIKDKLAIRYAAAHREHDGFTKSYLVKELGPFTSTAQAIGAVLSGQRASLTPVGTISTDDLNTWSQRLTVLFEPTSDLRFTLQGSTFRAKDNGSLAVNHYGDIANFNLPGFLATGALPTPIDFFTTSPQRQADFYSALTFSRPFSSTSNASANLTTDYDITPNLRTKLILGYSDSKNHSATNAAGIVSNTFALVEFAPDLTQWQHQFTAEWQLAGHALDNKLNWIGGLYYFRENGGENAPPTTRTLGNSLSPVSFIGNAENKSKSVFGNAVYQWTERLGTSVGLRYTEDEKSLEAFNRFATGICVYPPGPGVITSTGPNGPCSLTTHDKFSNTSWEVSVDYKFTDAIYGYAKANTGYRSGGQQLRAVNGATAGAFRPEKVKNYEGGVKSEFLDRRLRVNLAYFHTDYRDIQQSVIIAPPVAPTTTTQIVNQGKAQVDGVELESIARLTNHLTLNGAVGYTDFNFKDKRIQQTYTPKWKAALSAVYDTPTSIGDLNVRVDYSYTDPQFGGQARTVYSKLPNFSLLNARGSLTLPNNVELAIWGKNLTKAKYYTAGVASADIFGVMLGAPRTYGVEASYRF